VSTPETEAKRIRAFELYCTAGLDGKRRSVRSISQELGVALSTAQYWHKHDDWDRKLQKVLKETASTAASVTEAIRARLRKGILDGLEKANDIIRDAKTKDRDKILALRELTNIAIRLQALDLGGNAQTEGTLEFQDDLPINGTEPDPAPQPDESGAV
jgi:hypothetical protein